MKSDLFTYLIMNKREKEKHLDLNFFFDSSTSHSLAELLIRSEMSKQVASERQRSKESVWSTLNNFVSRNQMCDVLPNYRKWQIEKNTVVMKNPQKISDNVPEICFHSKCCQILNVGEMREGNQTLTLLVSHEIKPNGQKAVLAWVMTPAVWRDCSNYH